MGSVPVDLVIEKEAQTVFKPKIDMTKYIFARIILTSVWRIICRLETGRLICTRWKRKPIEKLLFILKQKKSIGHTILTPGAPR